MECTYVGCEEKAKYKLTQKLGKKQVTFCCENCAPAWVKNGTKSVAEKTHRKSFYDVLEVN